MIPFCILLLYTIIFVCTFQNNLKLFFFLRIDIGDGMLGMRKRKIYISKHEYINIYKLESGIIYVLFENVKSKQKKQAKEKIIIVKSDQLNPLQNFPFFSYFLPFLHKSHLSSSHPLIHILLLFVLIFADIHK